MGRASFPFSSVSAAESLFQVHTKVILNYRNMIMTQEFPCEFLPCFPILDQKSPQTYIFSGHGAELAEMEAR